MKSFLILVVLSLRQILRVNLVLINMVEIMLTGPIC